MLSDCSYANASVHNCHQGEEAGVICTSETWVSGWSGTSLICTPWDLCSALRVFISTMFHRITIRLKVFVFHTQNIPYLNLDKTCVEGQLYLVGGDDISRGRVHYCYEGVWYSLCGDEWSGEESRVVCQTLGYDTSIYGTT